MDEYIHSNNQEFEHAYGSNERLSFINYLRNISNLLNTEENEDTPNANYAKFLSKCADNLQKELKAFDEELAFEDPENYKDSLKDQKNVIQIYLLDGFDSFKEEYNWYSDFPGEDIVKRANQELNLLDSEIKKTEELEKNVSSPEKETQPANAGLDNDNRIVGNNNFNKLGRGDNVKNSVDEEAKLAERAAKVNERIQNNISDRRKKLLTVAKQLEESKTLFNSSEYNNLIKVLKKVGQGKVTNSNPNLSAKEKFAQELYAVHAATEAYLKHKAKDGVKPNVYKKLVAVERANEILEKSITKLGDDTELKWSDDRPNLPTNLSQLNVSLEARHEAARQRLGENVDLPKLEYDYRDKAEAFMEGRPEMRNIGAGMIEDCIHRADTCMCKIITYAKMEHPENLDQLANIRETFLEDPFPAVNEAKAQDTRDRKNEQVRVL